MADKDVDVLSKLNNQFGLSNDEYVPTGSIVFDLVISNGLGAPKGKFIEISSDSGYGKTTALLAIAKNACARGEKCVYLDVEKGVNQSQLDGIGLTPYLGTQFFVFTPSTFEQAEEIIDTMFVKNQVEVTNMFVDSITALIPGKLQDKSIADIEPGLHARFCAAFYQKYKAVFQAANVTVWFITQTRTKLNFRGMSTTGAAGGSAQRFYMDIRLEMYGRKLIESTVKTLEGNKPIPYGAHVQLYSIKNRHAPMEIPVTLTIIFGKGISNIATYQRWLADKGFITGGSAGWYEISFNGNKTKVRGEPAINDWLREHLGEVKQYIAEHGGFKLLEG